MLKKLSALILSLSICLGMAAPAFAAHTPSQDTVALVGDDLVLRYEANGIIDELYNTVFNGKTAQRKVIRSADGQIIVDTYILETDNMRTVYLVENGEIVSTSTNNIYHRIALMNNPPSDFSFIMSAPHPALDITGYLYGKNYDRFGEYYNFSWSAGTKVGIVTQALISFFGGTFNVPGLITSLGVAIVGGVIDGVLQGKVRYRYDTWDYEVWARNELGLRTYTEKIYERIYDSKGNFVEDIFIRTDGDPRDRESITIAGAYNVYISNL